MANATVKDARSVHGTNPQFLVEKIIRERVYESLFWKEKCFGVDAENLVDLGCELTELGGVIAGTVKPTNFMCLTLKMLQLQPDKDIVVEFIKNEDFKYLRCLGAFYMRLVGTGKDCYTYLEPLLADFRKVKIMGRDGIMALTHVDEFVDDLLREERKCDIILPRIQSRYAMELNENLPPRVSLLDTDEEEAGELDGEAEADVLEQPDSPEPGVAAGAGNPRGRSSSSRDVGRNGRSRSRSPRRYRRRGSRSRSRSPRRYTRRGSRSRSRSPRRSGRRGSRSRSRSPRRYRRRGSRSRSRSPRRYRQRGSRSRSRSPRRYGRRDSRSRSRSPRRYGRRNSRSPAPRHGRSRSPSRRGDGRARSRSKSPPRKRSLSPATGPRQDTASNEEASSSLHTSANKAKATGGKSRGSHKLKFKKGNDAKKSSKSSASSSTDKPKAPKTRAEEIAEANALRASLGLKPLRE